MALSRIMMAAAFWFPLCFWAQEFVVLQAQQESLCAALIMPQGNYKCDEFVVNTDDGFLLGVQRMSSNSGGITKKPVFLMHGILSGGDTWVLNPPAESLGFILADAGYDVWIGNFRTTDFSQGHVLYSQSEKGYWDWSLDELAEKDLVKMMELAYKTTGTRLHFIGFSQGTQAAFAATSQGMLVDWVDKWVMIAPVAYVTHSTTPIGILGAKLRLDQIFGRLQFYSLSTKTGSGKELVDVICAAAATQCFENWATIFTGTNCCINNTRRAFYDKYETQATSTKNLQHLGQQFRHGKFAKFDYGAGENMQRYKSTQPPTYDLSKVPTSNMLIINGNHDALADVDDVAQLCNELSPGYKKLFIQEYAHVDFIVGYNARDKLYDEMISFLEE